MGRPKQKTFEKGIIMQLTQKETGLLKDLKDQEKLCVDKYTKHASCAVDGQLKNLFTQLAQKEQQHMDTITQIECGCVPQMNASCQEQMPTFNATYTTTDTPDKQTDCYLCSDVLAGEKHVSHLYDTCVFEFNDEQIRCALNHIQSEEQNHGKMIYDYMKANSMY